MTTRIEVWARDLEPEIDTVPIHYTSRVVGARDTTSGGITLHLGPVELAIYTDDDSAPRLAEAFDEAARLLRLSECGACRSPIEAPGARCRCEERAVVRGGGR